MAILNSTQEPKKLVHSNLLGHDKLSKQYAIDAVNILIQYKKNVHEFNDVIIDFWPLPQRVMQRYQFDTAEQLNSWLDNQ